MLNEHRPWHIALISYVVLTLELALIRQVPAEVMLISYFTNLMLMAAFFGLGVGCIAQRARNLGMLLPIGLCLIAAFVYFGRGLVVVDSARDVHYWKEYAKPTGVAPELPMYPTALLAFVLCALPFVALGQRLAIAMNAHPRLIGYHWDIAGSAIGVAVFALGSALFLPPWAWPPLVMLIWALTLERDWRRRLAHVAAGLVFTIFAHSDVPGRWSPYYFVQYEHEARGMRVWVNSSFHQFAVDFSDANPKDAAYRDMVRHKFELPYQVYREQHHGTRPRRVLVLGAGTGNDVNIALRNGAQHVTAVEIDPVILELGRKYNRTAPYGDPRVHAVVDDARHYLRSTADRFDLVVLGTLDSQTLLSGQANIRLENYVYTRESFTAARDRLASDGQLAAYYSAAKPWMVGRLYSTVCGSFPGQCRFYTMRDPYLFNAVIVGAAPGLPGFRSDPQVDALFADTLAATDDWPFLYLEKPQISRIYLQLIGSVFLLILGVFAWQRRNTDGAQRPQLSFLLLGMGFTLMEAAAVVRLALLFGSTWVTNAVVFVAVLLTVFLGNLATLRGRAPRASLAWLGLFAGVTLNCGLPLALLVGLDPPVRALACALLIGLPVFFASVCFSQLFEAQATAGPALGINLVGAMAGGFIEYLSMLIGMRAVWLLVLVVYLAAYLFALRGKRAAVAGFAPIAAARPTP